MAGQLEIGKAEFFQPDSQRANQRDSQSDGSPSGCYVPAPPAPLPCSLAPFPTSHISSVPPPSILLSISFLLLQHQGARLPGSQPALARSGRWEEEEESLPPLPVCMQIGLVLIKRQLHISLKSPSEVGKEKAYLSGEAEVV
ncbi:hypothetical protein Q5P01_025065 [Channa striata]|uniref:Uncharacterized protein n=1 Tax=Channa striata TaxID=64152 RepID=A0AA88J4W1_CHASR|nr:hypothetical protein Q5P01_025065 [Channa striata]